MLVIVIDILFLSKDNLHEHIAGLHNFNRKDDYFLSHATGV